MAASSKAQTGLIEECMLQCPMCLYDLENPSTLQCLHNICTECLDEVKLVVRDNARGWECPQCTSFSPMHEVKPNRFLEKILEFKHVDETEQVVTCKQCNGETDAKWKCDDCRLELCQPCRNIHLNIPMLKNHSVSAIISSSSGKDQVIDELIFCKSHKDSVVKWNCKMCEKVMCFLCKIQDHDTHATESVDATLDRVIPDLDQKSDVIKTRIQHFDAKVTVLRRKIEETKKLYAKTRNEVQTRKDFLIEALKKIASEKEHILIAEEENAVKNLEETKLTLESEVAEMKQLLDTHVLTKKYARNTSLLQQLQNGLQKSITISAQKRSEPLLITTVCHQFDKTSSNKDSDDRDLSKLVGEIRKVDSCFEISGDGELSDKIAAEFNVKECFEKRFFVHADRVDVSHFCHRIFILDGTIFVPQKSYIAELNMTGEIKKKKTVPFNATVIRKLPTGELIVGSTSGLYCLNTEDKLQKLEDDAITDIDVQSAEFFCFNSQDKLILSFAKVADANISQNPSGWNMEAKIKLSFLKKSHQYDTMCCIGDKFLVCGTADLRLYVCNKQGVLLNTIIKGKVLSICGVDSEQNVILADYWAKTLIYLDAKLRSFPGTYEVCSIVEHPLDVAFHSQDGAWVLALSKEWESGSQYRLIQCSLFSKR